MSAALALKTVATPHVPVRYFEGGEGEALVYLHGAAGVTAADPLLNRLAQTHRVYAPLLPGYGDSEEAPAIRDMLDFTLHSWDVVAALGLKDPILVGHSMGGMIAAEMAATAPNDITRLALLAPAGLWLDDHPIPDIFALLPYELPGYLFHDPAVGAALMGARQGIDDPEFLKAFLVQNARQMGMAGRLLFPIPERGLAERLYRIRAKTAVVWGESDRLIPPVYARGFVEGIAGARLTMVAQAGHMLGLEQPEAVAGALAGL